MQQRKFRHNDRLFLQFFLCKTPSWAFKSRPQFSCQFKISEYSTQEGYIKTHCFLPHFIIYLLSVENRNFRQEVAKISYIFSKF